LDGGWEFEKRNAGSMPLSRRSGVPTYSDNPKAGGVERSWCNND
jgi:hypothetical protein